jgi:inhibitor of cysteine peptidase
MGLKTFILIPAFAFALSFLLALSSCSSGGSQPKAPEEVQLTDEDDGSSFEVARNGRLIVALQSNPSTGYSWSVAESTEDGLELQGEPEFVLPGSTTAIVGAPGTEVFTFKATGSGQVRLTLEYKRSFEPANPPAKTFKVTVNIK